MGIEILGYIGGALVVISLLPQLIKSWKTKLVRDISLWRYIIYVTGLILWIIYGILIENGPIMIMNGSALILGICILYLKIRYSKN